MDDFKFGIISALLVFRLEKLAHLGLVVFLGEIAFHVFVGRVDLVAEGQARGRAF